MKKSSRNFFTFLEKQIENHIVHNTSIIWFRRSVYLLLLLKMVFIWPELSMFYRHALNTTAGSLMPYKLMFLPFFKNYYNIYWLVASVIVAIAIFGKGNRWLSIAVYIISMNYMLMADQSANGGDSLHNFLIFMLVFIREGVIKKSARQLMNNAAIIIIQVHFCILYFVNAYGKIIHPLWRNGSYFKNLWHLFYYANPKLIPDWFFNPTLNLLTAWAVLLFEFAFPVLIWFKPYKKPLIYIGLLFHLGIAVFLSLPDFGITMAIVYILFYDFKQTDKNVSIPAPFKVS